MNKQTLEIDWDNVLEMTALSMTALRTPVLAVPLNPIFFLETSLKLGDVQKKTYEQLCSKYSPAHRMLARAELQKAFLWP